MVHSTDNYAIGKGILSIGDVAASPSFVEVGNCPTISLELTEERLEHFSSRGGLKNRDLYPLVKVQYTLTIETDEMTKENILLFCKGTDQGGEIFAFDDLTKEYSMKFVEDNPIGPNRTWIFHRGILSAGGALVGIGDDWKKIALKFEGLTDETYHSTSPYFTIEFATTTTIPMTTTS